MLLVVTVCEYYAHVDCQDFAVSDCKECATYVPPKTAKASAAAAAATAFDSSQVLTRLTIIIIIINLFG